MYTKYLSIPIGLLAAKIYPYTDWRLSILVALVFTTLIDWTISHIYYTHRARKWGCGPLVDRPYRLPGGYDMFQRAIKADRNHCIPEEFNRVFNEVTTRENATFRQNLFWSPTIVTADPKNIQAVLATQFGDFEISPLRQGSFHALLGVGIFTANGKIWEHSRALLRPQFTRDQVGDLDLEEEHIQDLFKHLRTDANGWTDKANLSPLFFRLTLDSATEFLFGQSVQSQIAALPDTSMEKRHSEKTGALEWDKMGRSFDDATHGLGIRARLDSLWWLHQSSKFRSNCREVHKFADYYVNLALTTDLYAAKEMHSYRGKRPKYIFLAELVKSTRDPRELRDQLLNILLAGRDTTAGLLGWTFWLLARHPEVFQKLRSSVVAEFGTYRNPSKQEITFATLKGCQYLQYTMNEVLRLFPSVPLNARAAVRDTTLPRGGGPDGSLPVFVRKGQNINYSVHIMHHRRELWGEDADEFQPERWQGRKSGWEFLPFNGGPRVCLGQQFALTEAGYVITRMLQRYDQIENLDPSNVPNHQYSVTTAPWSVDLRLHEAET